MNFKATLAFVVCALLAHPAFADIEEVTFTADGFSNPQAPSPGGPNPTGFTGTFFFNSLNFTGGLRPVFELPGSPPGSPGSAQVFFPALSGGSLTITYSNGSVQTVPFSSGFSLYADYEAPVCGPFDDCHNGVGAILTVAQFNASPDPWALVFNGMTGTFGELFPGIDVPAESPGQGEWQMVGGGSFSARSVPEPASIFLLALGLMFVVIGRNPWQEVRADSPVI
jgi:PEP-CTERM motif